MSHIFVLFNLVKLSRIELAKCPGYALLTVRLMDISLSGIEPARCPTCASFALSPSNFWSGKNVGEVSHGYYFRVSYLLQCLSSALSGLVIIFSPGFIWFGSIVLLCLFHFDFFSISWFGSVWFSMVWLFRFLIIAWVGILRSDIAFLARFISDHIWVVCCEVVEFVFNKKPSVSPLTPLTSSTTKSPMFAISV